jgi:hypothetical protein
MLLIINNERKYMANKDVAVGLSQLTGCFYKGNYYHNGEAQRPKQKNVTVAPVRVPPEDVPVLEIFSRLGIFTEDCMPKRKRRR